MEQTLKLIIYNKIKPITSAEEIFQFLVDDAEARRAELRAESEMINMARSYSTINLN